MFFPRRTRVLPCFHCIHHIHRPILIPAPLYYRGHGQRYIVAHRLLDATNREKIIIVVFYCIHHSQPNISQHVDFGEKELHTYTSLPPRSPCQTDMTSAHQSIPSRYLLLMLLSSFQHVLSWACCVTCFSGTSRTFTVNDDSVAVSLSIWRVVCLFE